MRDIFSQILNMSLTGSVVILFVLAARLLLKKAPKIFSYALWAVVLFRLLCPVSLPSPVSLLELTKPQVTETAGITSSVSYIPAQIVSVEPRQEIVPAPQPDTPRQEPVKTPVSALTIASYIWLAGMAVMAAYSILTYARLRCKLIGAVRYRNNIYLADHIASPFVLGILRPKIYLPSNTPLQEQRFIVAHERHHIRRGDHIVKLLAYGALCLHWFNPFAWVAFVQAGKDMEMSCDEAVIKKLGAHIRADYSASLLRLATHQRIIAGTPLAFGEGDTKGRVMNMAKWKKPKVWVSILCMLLCIAILVACAVNPESETVAEPKAEAETQPEVKTAVEEDPVEILMLDGDTTAGFGELYFTLPAGYTMESVEADAGDYEFMLQISDGTNIIGGVVYYDAPDFELIGIENTKDVALWNSDEWIAAMGLPDAADETLGYMGGNSKYADYEIEYFTDLPEPVENPVLRQHYIFSWQDAVYDFWFDKTVTDHKTIETIMETAAVGQGGPLVVETPPAEIDALEKCRAVLDMVQSGSCQISIEEVIRIDNTRWSVSNFFQHDGNWLKITDVDPESVNIVDGEQYSVRMAFLYAYGIRYSNEGLWGKAYTDINWVEFDQFDDGVKPWLARFQWSEENVTYMDTLTDAEGTTVMLRIDEPYYADREGYDPHYFVNFDFDPAGNFLHAKVQVNLFRNNELTETESIVTLDPETVATEIEKEYNRATVS